MSEEASANTGDYQRGIETMYRLWGEAKTEEMRAIWKECNPEVERYITAFALGEIWSRPTLDLKTRALVSLACAVALEREGQIRLHTHGALHSGATVAEVTETIMQLIVYASFPAAWQALVIATDEIKKYRENQEKNQ